jgi:hypothetical protein
MQRGCREDLVRLTVGYRLKDRVRSRFLLLNLTRWILTRLGLYTSKKLCGPWMIYWTLTSLSIVSHHLISAMGLLLAASVQRLWQMVGTTCMRNEFSASVTTLQLPRRIAKAVTCLFYPRLPIISGTENASKCIHTGTFDSGIAHGSRRLVIRCTTQTTMGLIRKSSKRGMMQS